MRLRKCFKLLVWSGLSLAFILSMKASLTQFQISRNFQSKIPKVNFSTLWWMSFNQRCKQLKNEALIYWVLRRFRSVLKMVTSRMKYFDFDQKMMIFRIQNDRVKKSWCKRKELNFSRELRLTTKQRRFENWSNFHRLCKVLLLKKLKENVQSQRFYELYIEILNVFRMKTKLSQLKISIKLCMNLLSWMVWMLIYLKLQVLKVPLWRNRCSITKSNQNITLMMRMLTLLETNKQNKVSSSANQLSRLHWNKTNQTIHLLELLKLQQQL